MLLAWVASSKARQRKQNCRGSYGEDMEKFEDIFKAICEVHVELLRHEAELSTLIDELKQDRAEQKVAGRFLIALLSRLDQVKLGHALELQLEDMEAEQRRVKRFRRRGAA